MNTLEKLTQDKSGRLHRADGRMLALGYAVTTGKIMTLTVANPGVDISSVIDEMVERKSVVVPAGANTYVASDFSGDTQHLRKSNLEGDEKVYSVYAVQFYYV